MRILFVVHGYPPRERAGTEEHTRQLGRGVARAGHDVHVLAATRAPGRRQYEVIEEHGVTRIVNNVPARPLEQGERDRAVEAIARRVEETFRPDLVHVQHLQFLSSGLAFQAPVVVSLHDQWAWCAAGGTGLLRAASGSSPCPGPAPDRCAPCHAEWRPIPGPAARSLFAAAGVLAPLVDPDRLHAAYKRLPARLRARVLRGSGPPERPQDASARNREVLAFYAKAARRIAPSRYLALLARERGLGPVDVIPHGADPLPPGERVGKGPLLFLGTIAHHKGPDLVAEAWREAFPSGWPGLVMHGEVVDPEAAGGHPVRPVLDREGVVDALRHARALVLGSRWPENAPLVVVEARAAGCPVVAPRAGGIPELVREGRDGYLFTPGDAEDLAVALRRVVDDPPGPPRPPPSLAEEVEATLAVYRQAIGRS